MKLGIAAGAMLALFAIRAAAQESPPIGDQPSKGDNTACWSYTKQMEVGPNITCTPLTPGLLRRLRFASAEEISGAMKESGQKLDDGSIHYMSNYARGNSGFDGDVTFTFRNGRAVIIDAMINRRPPLHGPAEYLWNGSTRFFCSDIPAGAPACN